MGLRDFFRKVFFTDPEPARDKPAEPSIVDVPRAEPDPLLSVSGLPMTEAVARVRRMLDSPSLSRTTSLALLRWLREQAAHADLTSDARVDLADFFLARAETETAETILRSVATGDARHAASAMMRLGDLAAQSGDTDGALGWFEIVLATDLEHPGARERHARMKKPVRAGEAGATLLSPEVSHAMGRFELLRELGRGGAGAVYLARDKRVGREVALKIYHPQARVDRNARLRGEAQVASAVASPCVVRVHDLFEETGALVMEHAAGGSLRARIARGRVEASEARGWLLDIARALSTTHERGWVHRDLKPGNVLLRADGRAALTDYGLARRVGQPSSALEGTAGYVPPEVREGGAVLPAVDVYAFGALTRDLAPTASAGLARLAERCLAGDPGARPRDGAALVEALAALR